MRWRSGTIDGIGIHPRFSHSKGRGVARTLDCLTNWGTVCDGSGLGRGIDIGTGGGCILLFCLWWSAQSNIAASVRSTSSWVGIAVKGDARIGWRRASMSYMAASVVMSAYNVVGIVIWYRKIGRYVQSSLFMFS